jgi:hypothetical protein
MERLVRMKAEQRFAAFMEYKLIAIIGAVAFSAAGGLGTAWSAESASEILPKFSGRELPQPPRQKNLWRAPAGDFPTNLISSVETLFDIGLSDPRGCEYREYEAVVGSVWGAQSKVKAHGWILPTASEIGQRFAVSWAGNVYPVLSVGAKANVKHDIEALLRAEEMRRQTSGTNHIIGLIPLMRGLTLQQPETVSISESNMAAIKVALLLRLGEGDLAEKYWNEWQAPGVINQQKEDVNDLFSTLAFNWAWSLFDRAVCAHMRGDDALALADCRNLNNVWPQLELEMGRRGFQRPSAITSEQRERDWFEFLEPIKVLLTDQERRARERPANGQPDVANTTNASGRIAWLISNFDEVAATQSSQPGGVGFFRDATFKALVAEGENAVEPLLDCLEDDVRLTRSVSFGRDFHPGRNILPVRNVAETALNDILKVQFRDKGEYRTYWNRYKKVPLMERWYRILADDQAGREQWLQAAHNVLSRSDGETVYLWRNAPIPDPTNQYRYVADKLRSKTEPSVSDLLIKRTLNIAPTNYANSSDCWAFSDSADLGLMLAEWNPKAAKRALGKIIERCPLFYAQTFTGGCGNGLAALVTKLAELGDTTGLDLYANWVRKRKLEDIQDGVPDVLLPLGTYPHHPSIREASVKFFRPEKRDWLSRQGSTDLLRTGLVLNEAFQLIVLDGFQNKTEAGTITLKNGNYEIRVQGSYQSGKLTPDAFVPKSEVSVSFRQCDHIAHRLSRIEGLPKLELYWPEAKRDEALAEVTAFLKENGTTLKLKPPSWPDKF